MRNASGTGTGRRIGMGLLALGLATGLQAAAGGELATEAEGVAVGYLRTLNARSLRVAQARLVEYTVGQGWERMTPANFVSPIENPWRGLEGATNYFDGVRQMSGEEPDPTRIPRAKAAWESFSGAHGFDEAGVRSGFQAWARDKQRQYFASAETMAGAYLLSRAGEWPMKVPGPATLLGAPEDFPRSTSVLGPAVFHPHPSLVIGEGTRDEVELDARLDAYLGAAREAALEMVRKDSFEAMAAGHSDLVTDWMGAELENLFAMQWAGFEAAAQYYRFRPEEQSDGVWGTGAPESYQFTSPEMMGEYFLVEVWQWVRSQHPEVIEAIRQGEPVAAEALAGDDEDETELATTEVADPCQGTVVLGMMAADPDADCGPADGAEGEAAPVVATGEGEGEAPPARPAASSYTVQPGDGWWNIVGDYRDQLRETFPMADLPPRADPGRVSVADVATCYTAAQTGQSAGPKDWVAGRHRAGQEIHFPPPHAFASYAEQIAATGECPASDSIEMVRPADDLARVAADRMTREDLTSTAIVVRSGDTLGRVVRDHLFRGWPQNSGFNPYGEGLAYLNCWNGLAPGNQAIGAGDPLMIPPPAGLADFKAAYEAAGGSCPSGYLARELAPQ